ncbi:MAG: agmatine deiminase family protein [Bryobacteraceae bacterium]
MPAEWKPHEATWLAWPHERPDWPCKFEPIPWVYAEIVRRLARVERVRILVQDAETEQRARCILTKSHAAVEVVEFFQVETDRSWIRDYGPIFTHNERGEKIVLNWRFNAWAKYDNWRRDDAVGKRLAAKFGWPMVMPRWNGQEIVLEGGSIDVNGAGSILTTEECLLGAEQARNPGFGRADMEAIFASYLGATNTVWLRKGIAGDDTHGHVDDLARFTDERTIVVASERDKREENYEPLAENLALLREAKDQNGEPFRIKTLPMPQPLFFDGQRLPASYANFYIANKTVLVPVFNDPNDRMALNKLAELFPDREVIGIAATDLVLGLGTLHCMTQQEPV